MGIHWQELILILLVVLLVFGPKRLPEIGSSLGRGIRGFRDSLSGAEATMSKATVDVTSPAVSPDGSTTPAPIAAAVEVVEPTSSTDAR